MSFSSKVLHVSEVVQGGIATHLNELLPLIAAVRPAGHVGLVLPADHVANLSADLRRVVKIFSYRRSGRNPGSLMRLAASLRSASYDMKPDLIHAHSSFAGMICRSFQQAAPVVYTPNGWSFDMEVAPMFQRGYAFIERVLARRGAMIINVSEAERARAISLGLPAERLVTVHNGISTTRLRTDKKLSNDGPIRLLFVGRFDRQKGLDWFLDVFKQLPPDRFTLQVVGAPTQGFSVDFPSLPNIQVVGWQSPEGVDAHLDSADALVMPSRWEGFSLLALEAMRRGTALLTSDRSSLPEAVNWGECGHVFSLEQPQALVEFLLQVQRRALSRWGAAGHQRFLTHFTNAEMHRKTEQVYSGVIAAPVR